MGRDPYLQIAFDTKRRIGLVSKALDQPHPGTAGSGLLELLEDVWRRKDPAVSALVLAACFGSDPRVAAVLVAFGFLAPVGEAWELCAEETDRLLSTHRQRVAAGKARAAEAGRSGGAFTSGPPAADQRATSGGPAGAPAEHQLLQPTANSQQPTRKKKLAGSAPADPPPTPVTKKSGPEEKPAAPVTTPSARPGWQALINRLTATFARLMPGAPKYDFRGHDAKALALVLDRGVTPDVLDAAWARALGSEAFPRVRTLPELEKNLNHFLGAAQGSQKRPELEVGGGREKMASETDMWEAVRENLAAEGLK